MGETMTDIKTQPIIGDAIVERFKSNFFEKHTEANGEMKAIRLWPAALIEETYKKAAAEIGGENEAQALKTFYAEMVHFLRIGTYEYFDLEEEGFILSLIEGIAP